jgi:hypothetical protein
MLIFDPEDGGYTFLRNGAISQKMATFIITAERTSISRQYLHSPTEDPEVVLFLITMLN